MAASDGGVVSTLAGSGTAGFANDTGTAAQFNSLHGITTDGSGNLYVADSSNNRIRKIDATGVVTTFAGSTQGFADDTGTAAQFNSPNGITIDGSGNHLYVADTGNHRIRKIVISTGVVSSLAGNGTPGYSMGTGTAAMFNQPNGITIDGSGNLYVADTHNHRIRQIVISSGVVTLLAGYGSPGYADGTGTAARFNQPNGITIDGSGNLYVADTVNHRIRKIAP